MRALRLPTLAAVVALASLGGSSLVAAPAAVAIDETCEVADHRPTVRFLDADSGVENRMAGGGCSINDLIDDEREWSDHGQFVKHVGEIAGSLQDDGVLSGREKGTLVSTAAKSKVGKTAPYEWLFDGSESSFEDWAYAGDGGFDWTADGTIRSRVGPEGGFGTLWYPDKEYGDFSLRLQFRDDAPDDQRANSGVQVRFPELWEPVEGCPTTFNGNETGNLSWIAVNCGHEVQINDSPETGDNDPRKTGSIYGFADLNREQARATDKGVWNDLEVRVVGQDYTVIRNGEVINEFENVPGLPFPGRPNDPDSSSRELVGHVGLQAHGSDPDVVSFRNVRVRELSEKDCP